MALKSFQQDFAGQQSQKISLEIWQCFYFSHSHSFISMTLPPRITAVHPNIQWHTGHSIMALLSTLYGWFSFPFINWRIEEGYSEEIGQPHYVPSSESGDLIILYLHCAFDGTDSRGDFKSFMWNIFFLAKSFSTCFWGLNVFIPLSSSSASFTPVGEEGAGGGLLSSASLFVC